MTDDEWEDLRTREERIDRWGSATLAGLIAGAMLWFTAIARGWV